MQLLLALMAPVVGCSAPAREVAEPAAPPPLPEGRALVRQLERTIQPGDSLGRVLAEQGIRDVQAVVEAARPYADLSNIRAGRSFTFRWLAGREDPVGLAYPLDEDRTLQVWFAEGGPVAQVHEVVYQRQEVRRSFAIASSLWEAAVEAGLRGADIVRLARIFEYEVDFNTELRQGDRFTVVAEGLHRDGRFVRLGEIHAAALVNRGQVHLAFRHRLASGEEGWYDAQGRPLKRAFLRSPLAFSRVTSGFNPRRYHPILKKARPHYGVDFGAPKGTPVRSVGDGVVTWAGRRGGYGLHVQVRHHDGWTSSYSHLSRILVRKGQRVEQGELVGKVGATGLATGPHLHYELRRHGKPVNPMTTVLPAPPPLPRSEFEAFRSERDRWLPALCGEGATPDDCADPPP